jgi:hypothetical protein
MEVLRKIVSYITFRPQVAAKGHKRNGNLRTMHWINRLSILMFLLALVVLTVRLCLKLI